MSVLGSGTQLNPGNYLFALNSPGGSELRSPLLVDPASTTPGVSKVITNVDTNGQLVLGSSLSAPAGMEVADVSGVSVANFYGDSANATAGNGVRIAPVNAGNAYNIVGVPGTSSGLILSGASGSTNITLTNGATAFNEDVNFNASTSFTSQAPGLNPTLTTHQDLGTVGNVTVLITNPTQGAGLYCISVGCAQAQYPDATTIAVQSSVMGIWNGTRWVAGGRSSIPNGNGLAYIGPTATATQLAFTNSSTTLNLYPVIYITPVFFFGGFTPA